MKKLFFRGIYFLTLAALVLLLAVVGSMELAEHCGKIGEIIGSTITVLAIFVPFCCTDEKHPYDKNLLLTIYGLLLVYGALAIFYGLGLLGNLVLGLNPPGIITCLLGFGVLTVFNLVFLLLFILIRKISNRKLTTK